MNLKHCLNWKVAAGLGVVALGVVVLAPHLISRALPLLLLAACPVSMLVMMVWMVRMKGGPGESPNIAALQDQASRLAAKQAQLVRDIARLEVADTVEAPR